jgi:leucyl-tRNA synthetase
VRIFEEKGYLCEGEEVLTGGIEKDLAPFTNTEWNQFSEQKKQEVLMHFRLAYLDDSWVNWCPALGTVLANDEVKDGVSERGGHPVERKLMKQWSLRITSYAERLLAGLDKIDWTESIKEAQRNWIGKSSGASVRFKLDLTPALSEGELSKIASASNVNSRLYKVLLERAKKMRSNPTSAEEKMWGLLRKDYTNFHFRRQHIIGSFIVDFVCLSRRLVVEIDGDIHDYQIDEDRARQETLQNKGFTVIRFTNDEVFQQDIAVTLRIKEVLNSLPEVSSLSSGEGQGEVQEDLFIEVFTTRPDTIFGVSFVVLAPEHELVAKITTPQHKDVVEHYVTYAKNRSERERQAEVKNVSGAFTGAYVRHPFNDKLIPVWIADYVLAGYGTGAVMAVPCGDQRDYLFAKHFELPILPILEGADISEKADPTKELKLINSGFLDGLTGYEAIPAAIQKIEEAGIGKGKINYRLRDAIFGRQRYWGEPIPVYYKDGIPYCVEESELPVTLPDVDKFLPTETGEPPLARAQNWKYKGQYEFETTTMPGWAGSSWYFLRYMDARNEKAFASKEAMEYWKQIDLYIGGAEHATGHLLYFRFWTKFLHDLGFISFDEPAQKLINQGMIQGVSKIVYRINGTNTIVSRGLKDKYETTPIHVELSLADGDVINIEGLRAWRDDFRDAEFQLENNQLLCTSEIGKMSKRWHNVVNPDDLCNTVGADTLRIYEMFLGPLEQHKPWDTKGIEGTSRFLKKLWRLFHNENGFSVSDDAATKEELKSLHKAIKKTYEEIDRFSFNTVVPTFMICVNELSDLKCNKRAILSELVILISPFAPHIAEELWNKLGNANSVSFAKLPALNESYLVEDNVVYPIQFNGKMRFNLELPATMAPADIEKEVLSNEQTQKYLEGKTPKKIIIVPKRIVNLVV